MSEQQEWRLDSEQQLGIIIMNKSPNIMKVTKPDDFSEAGRRFLQCNLNFNATAFKNIKIDNNSS
jgi:hypothetical protein